MKRKDLVNQTEGAFLRRNYLEAFVIQSAYIESILREYIEDRFKIHLSKRLCQRCDFMEAVRKRLVGTNLHDLIQLLEEGKYIDGEQTKKLLSYKKKRNNILHNLLDHISKPNFDSELAAAYEAGREVLTNKKFKWIEEIRDAQEEERTYMGDIISESLTSAVILNKFTSDGYRITSDENPKDRWHIHRVVGIDTWLIDLQKYLKKGWFAHFWRKDKIKVVFNDKIFDLDLNRKTWASAIKHGISQGIPENQLDFKIEEVETKPPLIG